MARTARAHGSQPLDARPSVPLACIESAYPRKVSYLIEFIHHLAQGPLLLLAALQKYGLERRANK